MWDDEKPTLSDHAWELFLFLAMQVPGIVIGLLLARLFT